MISFNCLISGIAAGNEAIGEGEFQN